ncbi:MAG: hypothetical protein ABSC50_14390 [Candidatus Bathyarchaeia archaeon]
MVDAEGGVFLSRTTLYTSSGKPYFGYDLKVSIANISVRLMKWLVKNFGGEFRPKQKGKFGKHQCYEWFVTGGYTRIEMFLIGIIPYMLIKRDQANVGLEFIRLCGKVNPQKRAELWTKMISLNSGKTPTTNMSSTQDQNPELKIESELMGDHESEPVVTQAS